MRMRLGARIVPYLLLTLLGAAAPARAQWLTDGAVVCDSAGAQSGPTLLADGSGGVIIAWQDARADTATDIFVQRLNAAGVPQWHAGGVPLGGSVIGDYALLPSSMVPDGSGNYIVAWIDSRAVPSTIIHMQKFTSAGQIFPAWPDTGVKLSINGYGAGTPTVVADGTGGAMAFWEDSRDLTTTDGQDIYGQRVSSNGTVLWRADGQPVCIRYGQQRAPRATSDGLGGAWITWEDPQGRRILVQHIDLNGTTQFDSTGIALCDSVTGFRFGAEIAPDGAGGAVVVWYDSRNSGEDIYARRINNLGVPQWTANGVNLCNDAGLQRWPTVCRGGASDYVVAWVDYRSTSPGDIYAQKVTSTGTTSWTANGVRIGRVADVPPWISSDGTGGAYVSWDDYGGGICYFDATNAHAYVQHVVSSSAIATGWPVNGRVLSALPGPRYSPACVNDGSGGVFVTWHDARNLTDCNIYAQRIGGGGEPVAVRGPSVSRGLSLLPPQPNPTRDGTRFEFSLAEAGDVRLQIVSASGRLVRVLAAGPYPEGRHVAAWDGLDAHGARAAAGFYLVRLEAGPAHVARPLILLDR